MDTSPQRDYVAFDFHYANAEGTTIVETQELPFSITSEQIVELLSKKGYSFDAEAIAIQERKKEEDRKIHEFKMRRDGYLPPLPEEIPPQKRAGNEEPLDVFSMTEEDKKILAKLKENAKTDKNSFYALQRDPEEEILHYQKLKRDGRLPDLKEKPSKTKTEL